MLVNILRLMAIVVLVRVYVLLGLVYCVITCLERTDLWFETLSML